MENQSMRRVAAGATALGASLALLGGGMPAIAAAQGADTGSLTINGSGVHTDSLASPTSTSETNPLEFSMWELCDLDQFPLGGPNGDLGPFGSCTEVVVTDGEMNIGGLEVPIPEGSLRISGQEVPELVPPGNFPGDLTFNPGIGTEHGVDSRSLPIPGGAFGSLDVVNLMSVNASVEALGTPFVDALNLHVDMPIRVKLENPLLGNDCYLGSEQDPIMLNLRYKEGHGGDFRSAHERFGEGVPGIWLDGPVSEDHDFEVPAAQGCGLGGSLNWLVNMRANTPSPEGNSIWVQYDAYNASNVDVRNWRNSLE